MKDQQWQASNTVSEIAMERIICFIIDVLVDNIISTLLLPGF
jgi:hypothetical protein